MNATGYCEYGQHTTTWKDVGGEFVDGRWRTICYRCERDRAMERDGVQRPVKGIDRPERRG